MVQQLFDLNKQQLLLFFFRAKGIVCIVSPIYKELRISFSDFPEVVIGVVSRSRFLDETSLVTKDLKTRSTINAHYFSRLSHLIRVKS